LLIQISLYPIKYLNKTMKTILILLFVGFCMYGYSQNSKSNLSDSCSNIFNIVSYYWKLDSLANNGFRLYAYDRLLNCKNDSLTVVFLVDRLGKPNRIRTTNKGTEYLYYYYDSKAMPEAKNISFECGYVYFLFDGERNQLTSVGKGIIDY